MKTFVKTLAFISLLHAILVVGGSAQTNKIDTEFRTETINELLRLLKDKYSYPEVAAKMETAIRERQKRGEYDSLTDGALFAQKMTADLRSVFDDKHLQLSYSASPISPNSAKAGAPSAQEIEAARRKQSRENFGVVKTEILKGNVGLIQLDYFGPLDWCADAYTAAFGFVANTDALIIDVRRNRGSMGLYTAPFFSSYLFDEPVHLNDYQTRDSPEVRQIWTSAKVPGRKYLNKPVYILTSNRTASGAEGFVSALKRLKRVTLVGETTMGATMPGMSHRINPHFSVWISTGRSSNHTTENKGVVPDIQTAPENAQNIAHLKALERLLEKSTDETWTEELKSLVAAANGTKP